MNDETAADLIRKQLIDNELSFREFMRIALYAPGSGYYATPLDPIGIGADYVTSGRLSPAFSFALTQLAAEFVRRAGDEVCSIVDIGCGDGSLISAIAAELPVELVSRTSFFGIDQALARVPVDRRTGAVRFVTNLREVPQTGRLLVLSYELFDALPFSRVVRRSGGLHELTVRLTAAGALDWGERRAPDEYEAYFRQRGIELVEGQFADVSLEWEALYSTICAFIDRGMIVSFDYGYEASRLFNVRARRWGTAAAYRQQQASRDLLAFPGEQDLTAHINFDDLRSAGERAGFSTLFFDAQAVFLLSLGITSHPHLQPDEDGSLSFGPDTMAEREAARALVLPDGPGTDIRVLVQTKGIAGDGWRFQRRKW